MDLITGIDADSVGGDGYQPKMYPVLILWSEAGTWNKTKQKVIDARYTRAGTYGLGVFGVADLDTNCVYQEPLRAFPSHSSPPSSMRSVA